MNKISLVLALYSSVIFYTTSLPVFGATVEPEFSTAVLPNDKKQQLLLITVEFDVLLKAGLLNLITIE